jgi:hypothetical protein
MKSVSSSKETNESVVKIGEAAAEATAIDYRERNCIHNLLSVNNFELVF